MTIRAITKQYCLFVSLSIKHYLSLSFLSCVGGVALSTLVYSHFCRVRFAESLVFCVVFCNLTKKRFSIFCRSLFFLFSFFLLIIVWSCLSLRFLISLFGIFKFFLIVLYHFHVNTMFLASSYTAGINNRAWMAGPSENTGHLYEFLVSIVYYFVSFELCFTLLFCLSILSSFHLSDISHDLTRWAAWRLSL